MQALLRKAMGGGEEMKLLLKILAAPVIGADGVCVGVRPDPPYLRIDPRTGRNGGGPLGLVVLITYSVKNGTSSFWRSRFC